MRLKRFLSRLSVICVLLAAIFVAGCAGPVKEGKAPQAKMFPKKEEPKIAEPIKLTTETHAKPVEQPVKSGEQVVLALKFNKGETATYKVIMETETKC